MMASFYEIIVSKIKSIGYSDDGHLAWIEFEKEQGNITRIAFPVEMPADIKLALTQLERYIMDDRTKKGLPAIQNSYTDTVDHLAFLKDEINQIAVIQSRFHLGHTQDTLIEKEQIPQVIQFLKDALQSFESKLKSPSH